MPARLEKFIKHFGAACIVILFVLMTLQVIFRYGFGHTWFFTEELGRYLLIWATLAGMAIEVRRGGHIRIAFLVERLPPRVRRIWQMFVDAVVFSLFLVLIYTGIDSTLFNHGQESTGLRIPLSVPFAAIPVFFIIAALFMLERMGKYRDRPK